MTKTAAFSTALDIIPLLGEKIYSGNLGEIVLRESIQNSLDARSTLIEVTLTNDGNTWTLVVTDNGLGIDDYNDHFLKIGGSEDYKRNHTDNSIIGGFGLAKLAFFACEYWKVESKGYEVNKDIAENQLPFAACDFNEGTRITLVIPDRKVSWGYTSWIKEYLSLINRPVTFIFNGEEITPFSWSTSYFGSETLKTGYTQRNGHILVRLNDLPTFYKWISGLENTVLLDFHSSLSPYDEGYPLIASRDSFKESTEEGQILKAFEGKLSEFIRENKKLEEEKRAAITRSGVKVMVAGKVREVITIGEVNPELIKENTFTLATYARYIKQICEIQPYLNFECLSFGVTCSNEFEACFMPNAKLFVINISEARKKGNILSLALHELTHYMGYDAHNESYSCALTGLTSKVLAKIEEKEFRW
jgi:hypothetical protein